jgi:hypothetical protein
LPTVKLAYRDLLPDRLSLIGALVGIVLSVVEVAVQFDFQFDFRWDSNRMAATLDRTQAELGQAPFGAKSLDDPSLLPAHAKHAILSLQGVAGMGELAVGIVAWRKLSGGAAAALLLGSEARKQSLPRNGVAGRITERSSTNAGAAPIGGAALGLIAGAVIPVRTRDSRPEEHIDALARLHAPGAFPAFIRSMILSQAVLRAIMGCLKGISFSRLSTYVLRDFPLLIVMTADSALLRSALTVDMGVFAPSSAIKITRDPAVVFSR